jgi:hypothetical protein
MEKVVHFFKSSKLIFYFKIFEFRKTSVDSNQVGMDLNYFEFYLNCSQAHLPFSPPPSYSWAPHPGRPTRQPPLSLTLFPRHLPATRRAGAAHRPQPTPVGTGSCRSSPTPLSHTSCH